MSGPWVCCLLVLGGLLAPAVSCRAGWLDWMGESPAAGSTAAMSRADQARNDLVLGRTRQAHEGLMKALLDGDERASTFQAGAMSARAMGKGPVALALGRRALAREPRSVDLMVLVGILESEEGHDAEALKVLEAAVQTSPDHALALTCLGLLRLREGDFRRSRPLLERAIGRDPAIGMAHAGLGHVLLAAEEDVAAAAEFHAAIKAGEGTASVKLGLGQSLYAQGNTKAALSAFDESLASRPDQEDCRYARALALVAAHRTAEGLAELKALVARNRDPKLVVRARAVLESDLIEAP